MDPLGGDQFDNEVLAEAEIEKLLKQVSGKCFDLIVPLNVPFVELQSTLILTILFFQYRAIEAERLNFIEVKEKTSRKYNKLLKILEKEKSDLQYQLDSEQKGIHARRDSDVKFCLFRPAERKSFKWTSFIALFFGFLTCLSAPAPTHRFSGCRHK